MRFPSLVIIKTFLKWCDVIVNNSNIEGRRPLHLFCMWNHENSIFNTQYIDMSPVPEIDFNLGDDYTGKFCLTFLLT